MINNNIWRNKATTKSLRLGKEQGNFYFEISINCMKKGLMLECEDIEKGLRLETLILTTNELIKKFPDLKEFETLLNAYETIAGLNFKLNQNYNYIKELEKNSLKSNKIDLLKEIDEQLLKEDSLDFSIELRDLKNVYKEQDLK